MSALGEKRKVLLCVLQLQQAFAYSPFNEFACSFLVYVSQKPGFFSIHIMHRFNIIGNQMKKKMNEFIKSHIYWAPSVTRIILYKMDNKII